MTRSAEPRVLQFCHGYDGPFLDCARQYASLFAGTPYKVTTVFLTGRSDPEVAARCASDEVLFLEYGSRDIRGLKLKAIRDLREIARSRDFRFCIAHRFKPIWIASLATRLPIVGVHHAFGDYQRLSRKVFAGLMSKRLSLLAVSDAVRDDIRRCLPKWPAERIETLYNRIDVAALQAEQVERLSARRQLRLPDEAWVVGNVGRLHPDKDQATLLRGFAAALPRLPQNSLLAILGSGRLEEQLKDLACELGIGERVLFLGNYEYAPNVDAVEWMLDEILPRVWAHCPEARMSVCGYALPAEWAQRWSDPRIEWQGFVPDLLQLQSSSSVFLAALRHGGGSKLKVLEALAAGLPLASTAQGVSGLE
ncbi:MAG: glycosyltransferase, partial [Pseudomonas aeruginosa]|nr:glycosyltransferase [Pseudomonas aeruginosa]